tara:strand:+ start:4450 stop:4929 length:480 start_codon:yes stop_codon:yes gene_type:complete
MPKNSEAWIYLLEDINDNRYIGSTGEKRLEDRLSTHKRDEREHNFSKKKKCSSMYLNLHNCVIIPLMKVNNDKKTRNKWESHFINNVYPECINIYRLPEPSEYRKQYYQNNRERCIRNANNWREKNKERVNASRREWYAKNKEKVKEQKRILREKKASL